MVTGSSLDSGPSRYVLNELDGRALVRTGPSVRAWITAAFALALLVVVVVALVSYESTADLVAAEELVNHTYEVLAVLESIGSSIAVAHSGVQAYALTGDERFLTGYELSIRAAWAGVDALRTLSADNPEEMDNVGRIEPSIDRLAGWLGETVAVRRDQSLAAAIARVRTHEGEDLARSLRGLLAETETVERTLLARRTTATGQTASRTLWIIQLGGAVGFVIVLAASLVIGREVDRRRRMGLVLQASELRYRVAGIVRVRLDGRMVECNPAYVRMLGYESQAEVLDLNVRDVYANPEDCERVLASLRTPTGWMDVGLRLRRKDGTPIWVSSTVMETFDGEDSGYETIVIDITERKEVDDDIRALRESLERQVGELDAVNRDLDAFSYSISHDLRAPLRAMQGFSEALLEDYGDRLDATGHDYAHRIVAASRQMDTADPGSARLQPSRPHRDRARSGEPRDGGGRGVRAARAGGQGARGRDRGRATRSGGCWPTARARPDRRPTCSPTRSSSRGPRRPPRVRIRRRARRRAGSASGWRTTASASPPSTTSGSSGRSSGCTACSSTRAPGSAWPSCRRGRCASAARSASSREPGAGSRFWVELREAEAPAA